VLIVAEITMTLVLLAGAGFMIRSFLALYRIDVRIETDRILTMNLSVPDAKYPTPEVRAAFYKTVDERLNARRGIRATPVSSVPFGGGVTMSIAIDGRQNDPGAQIPQVTRVTIGPRYFDVTGLDLQRGRRFTDDDGSPGHEVAIINQRMASQFFAHDDPIGRRIRLSADARGAEQNRWLTIVGVSPTVRQRNTRDLDPDAVVYVPYRFSPDQSMILLVRTDGDPATATSLVREDVRVLDPGLPLFGVATLNELLAQFRWPYRVFGAMFTTFAAIALLLSAVALYATAAHAVAQRTREIGLRMALGAEPRQVRWLILRTTLMQLAIGLTLGMAGALGVGRLLRTLLARVRPTDPPTLMAVTATVVVVALVAAYRPARSATAIDPADALRCE
jgi:putative ABC transport system permease protein